MDKLASPISLICESAVEALDQLIAGADEHLFRWGSPELVDRIRSIESIEALLAHKEPPASLIASIAEECGSWSEHGLRWARILNEIENLHKLAHTVKGQSKSADKRGERGRPR